MSFTLAHQSKTNKAGDAKTSTPTRHSSHHRINNLDRDSPDSILYLQQAIGDHAVQSLMRSSTGFDFGKIGIQPKLKISQLGNAYEQEADTVAEQVMRMAIPLDLAAPIMTAKDEERIARKCAACKTNEKKQDEDEKQLNISRKSSQKVSNLEASDEFTNEINSTFIRSSSGSPLDAGTRSFMESRFGYDFSSVKIYDDETANKSAASVNALAYTMGNDIVFGQGQYQPNTQEGIRLLAHELTHVVQHNTLIHTDSQIAYRNDDKSTTAPQTPKAGNARTAGAAPKLILEPSINGEPCACLVFIHNDEENARKTAELMHKHCSYNLVIISKGSDREISIPGNGKKDPNELFDPAIARRCLANPQSCKDFLTTKSGTTNASEILEFVQIQFFLAVHDGSKGFSLPVVALHNNALADTEQFRKKKGGVDVSELKTDVDQSKEKADADSITVAELKNLIQKKFGESIMKRLTKKGNTNIFRWCVSPELAKCHIGDPDNPDQVIWTTNENDYKKLSEKKVNVVLQSDLASAIGTTSATDLSTLFLVVGELLGQQAVALIEKLISGLPTNVTDLINIFINLDKLKLTARNAVMEQVHFLNIETPGTALAQQTDKQRIENYEFIVSVLREFGLHCCGQEPAKAEASIKEGLKLERTGPKQASPGASRKE